MKKSKIILKKYFCIFFVDICFLFMQLLAAYAEKKPVINIVCTNAVCMLILFIYVVIRIIKKNYEISMYVTMLLLGCSIAWMIPICLYGSIFNEQTGVISLSIYLAGIVIGLLIPVIQGRVNKKSAFYIVISKILVMFASMALAVLALLGRVFRGSHGGRLMDNMFSDSTSNKIVWGCVLFMAVLLGAVASFNSVLTSQNPDSEYNTKKKK